MSEKETIERIAAAINEQNEEAIVVQTFALVECFLVNIERIATSLEAIVHNTRLEIIGDSVTDSDIGFAVAAMKGLITNAGTSAEVINEAISRLQR